MNKTNNDINNPSFAKWLR